MKNKVILAIVLVFFLVTRIYKIAEIPGSVYWDEASIGYNAYSIATDLKDEWGVTLPLHFRAFGEFKLPVYIYSVVPFVKVLGLNEYSVRLPAVFYSLGSLIAIYFLVKKISGKEGLGILSTFILSVSPWLFIFSRTGYEATAGLFFFLLGTYIALQIDRGKLYMAAAVVVFILSFYSYNSFRIIIPIWLVFLFLYRFHDSRSLKKNWVAILISAVLFLTSLIPVYRLYKYDAGAARLSVVQISNKLDFVKNYFSHLGPGFLFFKGDTNSRSQIPGHGELFWIDVPLLFLGLIAIFKSKKILYYLPLITLLLSFIPAALTKESPHALRSILAAPSFAVISTFGVALLVDYFKKYRALITGGVVVTYLMFFSFYARDFFGSYGFQTAADWQYQYKQMFSEQKSGVVTDRYAQPYIFALFYLKYPPQEFRDTVRYNPVSDWGFSKVASFDGFQFVNK